MPKPNQTVTLREKEICGRVRYFRKVVAKWSQPVMAQEIGMSLHRLAGVEYGRVPLHFGVAISLCDKCDINPRWLAIGELPIQPRLHVVMHPYANYPNSALFSMAFDAFLDGDTKREKDRIIAILGEENYKIGNFHVADSGHAQTLVQSGSSSIKKAISLWLNWLPDDLLVIYCDELLKADKNFQSQYAARIAAAKPPAKRDSIDRAKELREIICKSTLDTVPPLLHAAGVQNEIRDMKGLIARLKKVTAPRGAKAALAREFKVTRQAVNQWLSRESNPSADIAIRLQYWKPKLPEK
jgi:transcriptional regulator with XRE-family HTH domain